MTSSCILYLRSIYPEDPCVHVQEKLLREAASEQSKEVAEVFVDDENSSNSGLLEALQYLDEHPEADAMSIQPVQILFAEASDDDEIMEFVGRYLAKQKMKL